jgi:hypothetical protein
MRAVLEGQYLQSDLGLSCGLGELVELFRHDLATADDTAKCCLAAADDQDLALVVDDDAGDADRMGSVLGHPALSSYRRVWDTATTCLVV